MKWKKNFGKWLKLERLTWGMSRRRLSKLSHVDIETIADIENGINKEPDFDEMLNICDVLESSVYFFLEEGCDKND